MTTITPSYLDLLKERSWSFVFLIFLNVLVLSGFLFLDKSIHRSLFYVSGIYNFAFIYFRYKQDFKDFCGSLKKHHGSFLKLLILFLAYNFVSVFWSSPFNWETLLSAFKKPVFILLFVTAFSFFCYKISSFQKLMEQGFVVLGLLTAIALLTLNVPDSTSLLDLGSEYRLKGFGRSDNSNILAEIYSITLLITLFGTPFSSVSAKRHCARIALSLVFLFIIFATGSRAAFVGILMAIPCALLFQRNRTTLFVTAFAGTFALLVLYFNPNLVSQFVERADSFRFQIWFQAIDLIIQKPLFGYGHESEFLFITEALDNNHHSSAHSIILGTLLYTGMFGLALLILLGGFLLYKAYETGQHKNEWLALSLLIFGMSVTLFSGHTLILNLNGEWWYSWIPLACVLGSRGRNYP